MKWLIVFCLLLIILTGCPDTTHPTFPPPEGYDSWEEYENRNQNPATLSETIPPETHEPEPDTTPPIIFDVNISHITESSATIAWETDELAICQIEYGEDNSWDEIEDLGSEFNTSHSVTLSDLEIKATYQFRIQASDNSGNETLSEDYDFTTKTTEECMSIILYASMIIGGRVHQLSFGLINSSSQTITVTKVEVLDEHDDVEFTMSKSDIEDTWGSGEVDASQSVSASISFGIQPTTTEVEDWQVKWYCLDAEGDEFTVKEQYNSP